MAAVVDKKAATTPNTLSKVPEPLLLHILSYTILSISDFSVINSLNKYFYKFARQKLWFTPFLDEDFVFAKRTMVQTNRCMSCDKQIEKSLSKVVAFHDYPKGCYIYCNRFKCVRSCIRSYMQMAQNQRIKILTKPVLKPDGLVRRSSGKMIRCRYAQGWLWSNHSVRCYFFIGKQDYYKDVPIRYIQNEFIINDIHFVNL